MELYYLEIADGYVVPDTPRGPPPASVATPGPGGARARTNARTTHVSAMCNHCKNRVRRSDSLYCDRVCANLAKGEGTAIVRGSAQLSSVETTSPIATKNPLQAARNIVNTCTTSPVTIGNRFGYLEPRYGTMIPPSATSAKHNISPVYWDTSPGQICQTPGCASPARVAGGYCGETHKQSGENGCIYCRRVLTGPHPFCPACCYEVSCCAPMIVEVPRDHKKYKGVKSQFQKRWLRDTEYPEVRAVYKIVSTDLISVKYRRYLNRVEAKEQFATRGGYPGNENRRWHGTVRMCNIGDEGVTEFCSNALCSLCCIMKISFDRSFPLKRTRIGRFGEGIYTSSTSSKADNYSYNGSNSDWKGVLLNDVVVGNGYEIGVNNRTLKAPPPGYDSILSYDELVVYNDAIRPSYLVMYDVPK